MRLARVCLAPTFSLHLETDGKADVSQDTCSNATTLTLPISLVPVNLQKSIIVIGCREMAED